MLQKIIDLDWPAYRETLLDTGHVLLPALFSASECWQLSALYEEATRFRNTIVMQRHGYGSGEYKYFQYPLPPAVEALRHALYVQLAPAANRLNQVLNVDLHYPETLADWLHTCHTAGQVRPTPLMLRYQSGDWNALHQDLYGELYFPFQAVLFLSQPGTDYEGGEFVLHEQRPRMQSKATVLQPAQGQILVFATRHRPTKGMRGYYRVSLRHGVSEVRRGIRVNLGLIFHDAA